MALFFNRTRHTVSKLLSVWENRDNTPVISVLNIRKKRGAKVRLSPVAHMLPELIEEQSRNLKPLLAILEKEHGIKVGKQTLQKF